MATKQITIETSSLGIGADISTFSLYHTSAIPANLITSSITKAAIESGFSYNVDPSYFTFVVQDETYGGQQTLNLPKPTVTSFTPTSGKTNDIINITGTGFAGATAVLFGETAAGGFHVVSNTLITASVGAGSTGEVAVVNPKGIGELPTFNYQTSPTNTTYYLGRFGYDKDTYTGLCGSPNSYPNYNLYAQNYDSLAAALAAAADVYTTSDLTGSPPYGWYKLRTDSTPPTTNDVDFAYEINLGIPVTQIDCTSSGGEETFD